MKRLKKLVQRISGVVRSALQPMSQSEFRKQYLGYQVLVDNLMRAEKNLTKGKERRRSEYEAVLSDAVILKQVIEQRVDAIKYDFLIEHLRGIVIRCKLVIKNIEMNTRSAKHMHHANKRKSDFKRDDVPTPPAHLANSYKQVHRSDNVVSIHRVGVAD